MPLYLRQSTASQEIPLGYFVDSVDGNTEETGLTIANTDIQLFKSGATALVSKNSGGATHMANGIYSAVLDAADSDTIGALVIFVHVAGALPVRLECCVLDEVVFDVMFGTVKPQTTADPVPSVTGAVGSVTGAVGSVTGGVGGNLTGSVGSLSATAQGDVRTAVGVVMGDLDTQLANLPTNAELATALGTADDATLSAISALNNLSQADVRTAIGIASANLDTQLAAKASQTSVDEIPTNAELATALGTSDDAVLAILGTPAGASLSADVAAVKVDSAAILVDTDEMQKGLISGSAAAGTLSTTQMTSNLTGYANDQLLGRVITFLSGACDGEQTVITDYVSSGGLLTFVALTTPPGSGDLFKIT